MRKRGSLIIISGQSGVGKGTVCKELMTIRPDLTLSISATTRKKRSTEVDGENYYFYSQEKFEQLIEDEKLLEYALVHDRLYGTPKAFVEEHLALGDNVILEIDVQGAAKLRNNSEEGVYIFLLPPKFSDLEDRIRNRGTEEDSEIQLRLCNAKKEIEMLKDYDYAVVNENVSECAAMISKIIDAENHRVDKEILEKYWRECRD